MHGPVVLVMKCLWYVCTCNMYLLEQECSFETCASWDIMLPNVRIVVFILSFGVLN